MIVEFDVAIWRNVYAGSIIKLRRGQWNLFHLLAFSSIFLGIVGIETAVVTRGCRQL